MSFIFDALKKSQTNRQQQSGPATIAVETAPRATQPHNWLAIVVAVVALNLAVIAVFAWLVIRDKAASEAVTASPATSNTQSLPTSALEQQRTQTPITSPAQQIDSGGRGDVRPLSAEVRASRPEEVAVPAETPAATVAASAKPAANKPTASENAGLLPTLTELQLDQRIQVSPLHIDVHVFNENPQRRFVLINARKYREGERLSEGPLLEEIRRDGLVMYYRDQRFLVPRR